MNLSELARNLNYAAAVLLFLIGVFAAVWKPNLIKKVFGLVIIQSSMVLFMVSMGLVGSGGTRLVTPGFRASKLVNPLPLEMSVLILVVSIGLFAFALALCIKIYEAEGTLDYRALMEEDS